MSPAVVSRVFNEDPTLNLRDETRAAVVQAIKALGYTPHSAAQGLRKARTRTIGLVLDQATNPMLTDVVTGAQRAALRAGYVVILIDAKEIEEGRSLVQNMIASSRIDGLLLHAGFGSGAEKVIDLAAGLPAVVLNDPGPAKLSSVRLDDEAAVQLAARHLVDLGHRHIGFVEAHDSSTSNRRRDAFLRETGGEMADIKKTVVPCGGWTPQQSHDAVVKQLETEKAPTAYIAVNAISAVGVMSGLTASGFSVPRDVSVIAIHDGWFAPHLNPPLTTIRLPLPDLGRAAVELLISLLEGAEAVHLIIDDPAPTLVQRHSTAIPPAPKATRSGKKQAYKSSHED